jgi:hypothetical protein
MFSSRSAGLTGTLLDSRMRSVTTLRKMVLVVSTRGAVRFLRGIGETESVPAIAVGGHQWLRIRRLGLLRVTVTEIEAMGDQRKIIYFTVRSAPRGV